MIITKLINNLKCLTLFYQSLVWLLGRIEPTLSDPFQTSVTLIESSNTTSETSIVELPEGVQIISILLVRVGESGFDDVETIVIDTYSVSISGGQTYVTVNMSGGHDLHDYELQIIYRLL